MKKILVLAAVLVVALAASSAASANALSCAHSASCNPGTFTPPHSDGKGTLPFTGLDLAGIAVVGGVLLVGGFTLQRASRRRR